MKKQKFNWDLSNGDHRVAIVEQVAASLGCTAHTTDPRGVRRSTISDLACVRECEFAPLRIEFDFKTGARCYVAGYCLPGVTGHTDKHLDYHCGHRARRQVARANAWGCVIKKNSDPTKIAAQLSEKIAVAERTVGIALRDRRKNEARMADERAHAGDLMCAMFGFEDAPNERPIWRHMSKHVPGYQIKADLTHTGSTVLVTLQVTMSAEDAGEAVGYLTSIPSVALPGAT